MSELLSHDRLMDLYADLATQGLSGDEMVEVERLERALGMSERDREAFELAAAAVDLALAGGRIEPAPVSLKSKLAVKAISWRGGRSERSIVPADQPEPRSIPFRAHGGGNALSALGWLVAAACLALAAVAWFTPRGGAPMSFERIVAAPDSVRWAWAAGPDRTGQGVAGEVVFSAGAQQGYMTFAGLPALEDGLQYQLWIFDPEQKHPIDGGVFDAPVGGGLARVPIHSKLAVSTPAAFAVTVEKRGGVVVSDQSRVTVIAKPS